MKYTSLDKQWAIGGPTRGQSQKSPRKATAVHDDEEQVAQRQYRIQQRVQAMQPRDAAAKLDGRAARAGGAVLWSRVFLWAGVVLIVIPTVGQAVSALVGRPTSGLGTGQTVLADLLIVVVGAPAMGYVTWGTYWGWIWTWRWAGRLGGYLGGLGLLLVPFFLWILATIALIYGVLGGGIYEWHKARQLVAEAKGLA